MVALSNTLEQRNESLLLYSRHKLEHVLLQSEVGKYTNVLTVKYFISRAKM